LALKQPLFGAAGFALVVVVALIAYSFGRQNGPAGDLPTARPLTASILELDPERLMTVSVGDHLDQLNIAFTQFVHSEESRAGEAGHATEMLLANRLYRQVAAARGDQQLADFLAELEPLLIEMAYEAQKDSALTRQRMQNELNSNLLFRLRLINSRFKQTRTSI